MRRNYLFPMKWFGWIALLLIGFILRLWGIERYGLWIDEITTAQCLELPLRQVLDCHWVQVGSPMLFVATNFVYIVFGSLPLPAPEWLVRLPEVCAGTLTIFAAWLATRELLGTRGAWLNALLWTFAPTAVAYSQEARMYAWLMLSLNLSAWLLIRTLRSESWRVGIAYGIVSALSFYSHYLGLFVIVGQLAFASVYVINVKLRASKNARRVITAILCGALVAGVLILLWLPNILKAAQTYLLSGGYTQVALTPAVFTDAQTWIVLNDVAMPFVALGLAGLELLGVWWMFQQSRTGLALVGCWLAAPFGFLLLRHAGWTAMRYWIVIQPPVYWLLTAGALAILAAVEAFLAHRRFQFDRRIPYAFMAVASVALLLPSLAQFYNDQFESRRFDDWRGAARELRARAGADDLLLAFDDAAIYHVMALNYYLGAPRVKQVNQVDGDVVARAAQAQGRAWGIVYARTDAAIQALRAREQAGFDVFFFKNLALVSPKPAPQETVRSSAVRLLDEFREWDASKFSQQFSQALALLDAHPRGENLMLNPQLQTRRDGSPREWQFNGIRARGIGAPGERALQLTSETDDGSVIATQKIPLAPDRLYVFHFECRHTLTRGTQRTYVTFDAPDNDLVVFPGGAGYVCPDGAAWHTAEFAFRVPSAAQAVPTARILLRNAGVGDAAWRNLALREIISP